MRGARCEVRGVRCEGYYRCAEWWEVRSAHAQRASTSAALTQMLTTTPTRECESGDAEAAGGRALAMYRRSPSPPNDTLMTHLHPPSLPPHSLSPLPEQLRALLLLLKYDSASYPLLIVT